MKNKLYAVLLLLTSAIALCTNTVFAQQAPNGAAPKKVYLYVEPLPEFKGGEQAMLKFLSDHIPYSSSQPEGKVVLKFLIDADGSIKNVEVVQKLDSVLDKACIQAAYAMDGQWTSAVQNGKAVPCFYTLPILFKQPQIPLGLRIPAPTFDGGINELVEFIKQNRNYPSEAKKEGVVEVGFDVNEDGTVSNLSIKRGLEPLLDKEALRIVALTSGKWRPAIQNGKKVKAPHKLPIRFEENRAIE